jgi:hypothetical protein
MTESEPWEALLVAFKRDDAMRRGMSWRTFGF